MFVYVQIFTIYLFVIFGFGETVGFTFLLMTNYYAGRQLKLFSYWINILPAFSRIPRDHDSPNLAKLNGNETAKTDINVRCEKFAIEICERGDWEPTVGWMREVGVSVGAMFLENTN